MIGLDGSALITGTVIMMFHRSGCEGVWINIAVMSVTPQTPVSIIETAYLMWFPSFVCYAVN